MNMDEKEARRHAHPRYSLIGQGGGGTDPAVPQCPVCQAYGGGGHGGNCPNDGTDAALWAVKP